MDTPLVSIAVITYNSSKYVLETLDSVKIQTYSNIELIISDDCSNDDTVQLCENWIEKNKERFVRTQIVTVDKNTGVSANCNRAEDACDGEWVKMIAGDDRLLPFCIKTFVNYISVHQVYCVFSKVLVFGNDNDKKEHFEKNIFNYDFFSLSLKGKYDFLINKRNCIPAASCFYSLSKIRDLGIRYDEKIPMLEDLPRWMNLLRNGVDFAFIDSALVEYRVNESAISNSEKYTEKFYESHRLFFFYYQFGELLKKNKDEVISQVVSNELEYRNKYFEYLSKYNSISESNAFKLGKFLLTPLYIIKKFKK